MSEERTLLDLAACLKSSKKKDRVKGLTSVLTLIEQDNITKHLSRCSRKQNNGTSWDILFVHVHDAVMGEMERGNYSGKFLLNMGESLSTTVQKAQGQIKAKSLASAVLSAFETQTPLPADLGKIYFELASGHLLEMPKYRAEINNEHWTDLVNMCTLQYNNPRPGVSSLKFLELLCKVITSGVRYGLTLETLTNLLPFFTNILLSDLPPSASFECNLLLAVNTTLLALVADARYKVVSFTETVIESVTRMYKSGSDNNSLIFQTLGIAVNVHHPQGAGYEDPLYYAQDNSLWKQFIPKILQLCEKEVCELLRSGAGSPISNEFMSLFVDVSHVKSLIRSSTPQSTPDEEVDNFAMTCTARKRKSTDCMNPTQKRAKLVSVSNSLSNVLADMSSKDCWFWLSYLAQLLNRRPSAVKQDLENIVRIVSNLSYDSCSLGPLIQCAVLLFHHGPDFSSSWSACFESLARAVVKDNSDDQHRMLQILIKNHVVKDSASFLKLYLSGNIPCTAESMRTLATLIRVGAVITQEERCTLLRWVMCEILHPAEAAELVLALLLKEFPLEKIKHQKSKDFTDVYTILTLNEEAVNHDEHLEETRTKSTFPPVADCFLDIIANRPVPNNRDYQFLVEDAKILELILRISSSILREEGLYKKLLTLVQLLFEQFMLDCESEIRASKPFRMEVISRLFALELAPTLKNLIRDWTSEGFTEMLVDLKKAPIRDSGYCDEPKLSQSFTSKFTRLMMNLNQPDLEKMFITGLPERTVRRRLRVLELLCQLGDIKKLIGLMDEINTDVSNYKLRVLLQLIYSITDLPQESCSYLNQSLKTLHSIHRQRPADNAILHICLEIIRNMVPAIGNHGDQSTCSIFVSLMEGIRNSIVKRKGKVINLVVIFIEILAKACDYPQLAAQDWESSDGRMVDDILHYVNNSSIFVRLAASRAVGKVMNLHATHALLQRLRRQLAHPPLHQDNYGKMAVTSSSLMAVAYALSASSVTRFRAAYTAIEIIHTQNFGYEMIPNFLGLLSRLLECEDAAKYFRRHFKDLLCEWLTCGNSVNDFPYPIVKCRNTVHFFNEFGDVIGAVCFVSQKGDMLDELADRLNTPLAAVLEKSFPVIACMTNGQFPARLNDFICEEKQQVICTEFIGKIAHTVFRESSVSQRTSVLSQVITSARAVQQTLLLFEEDLVESVTEEDILESISQYSEFVKKYVDETRENIGDGFNVNVFVLRDTISVILRFLLGGHSRSALEIACGLMQHIIDGYVRTHKAEITDLLPGIVNVLVTVSGKRDSQPAVNLLRYLIGKKEEFSQAFSRLDPLPEDEVFAGLVDLDEDVGLREEMKRFAQVDGARGRRVGGLARLLRALENHKQELRQVYEEAWISEGVLLHDVLQQLVLLCAHKDEAVRTEAAKCLGELGPADLNTLVIKREENEGSAYVAVEHRLVDSTLAVLGQIIQTESLSVKKVACQALYGVLRFEGDSSQCSRFCAPFCSQNTPRALVFSAKNNYGPPLGVWLPIRETPHDLWVQQLTIALLETVCDSDGLSDLLQEMCAAHGPFAQQLLPLALGVVVEVGDAVLVENITQNVNEVFLSHRNLALKSVATLVEAVDYLRRWNFRRGRYGPSLNDDKTSMELDLLAIAEAASNCGAHFTSMMYAELWYEDQKTDYLSQKPEKWRVSVDDLPECRNNLSRVMRSGFASIGVLDGLHGCGLSHLADPAERVTHFEQIGRSDMCLVMHDVMRNSAGVAKVLLKYDLPYTLTSLPGASDDQLACAAKLGNWNLVPVAGEEASFHGVHYSALKALHNHDMISMMDEVGKATDIVLKRISENKMESPQSLYESLSHLQCLKQLRDVHNLGSFQQLREKWEVQDCLKPSEFSLMAKVLDARCVLIKELCTEPDLLAEQYLRLCKLARRAGENEVALRNILQLNQLTHVREDLQLQGQMEEARYYWENGVHETGTFLMSKLLKNQGMTRKNDLYAKFLQMYGKWMVERKMENPHHVIEKYFKTSLQYAKNADNKLEAYAAVAKLADENYIQLKEYMDSTNFENQKMNLEYRMHSLKNNKNVRAKKEGENDQREVSFLQQEAKNFLSLAVRYYVLSLQSGDKYDHFVFRLISLWLSNPNVVVENDIAKIPSYKFISLLPQIVPRMHGDSILTKTVERILNEHPYHTLPILFALKNSHADQQYMCQDIQEPTTRMRAAFLMIKGAKRNHAVMIDEMERFTAALIHLSNIKAPSPPRPSVLHLDSSAPLVKLPCLSTVMMPSEELQVKRNLRYDNIVGIAKFKNSYELVGGVNCPKKIECLGTDGKLRILLVKGQDDLRQDAVMQQVFSVINSLLARNEETARHKLSMRTYRVVPLSQLSGIIGWCENTQPLGVYLVGRSNSGGAHERFRPTDMKSSEARQMLAASDQNPDVRLADFLKICKRFQPVGHYFFLEKFPSAGMAFDRRLAYTRSVATSSMIGYILGLGDRHVMNILIDNVTAEVIHIDFGISFEQGETLKIPETVPFRLTRDIVDAMGLTGVDGVFRACCKRTMEVLRKNKDTIITLLEVLLYDPLNNWTINSTPASSVLDKPGNVNAMAERALSRVALKLQGLDKGVVTSVEGQVNGLIQQAMDPSRLCRIFHGWQPYI